MASPRVRKIADRIQVIVAEMLERRIKDPRLGFVTITDVRLTGDSQQATVFYTVLGEQDDARRHGRRAGVGQGAAPLRGRQAARHAARAEPDVHPRRAARERPAPRRGAGPGPAVRRGRGRGARRRGVRRRDGPVPQAPRGGPLDDEPVDSDVDAPPGTTGSGERGTPAGLVVVDKPAGITSHDVVARVRRLAGTRKVGHAGTLDPMATGVLVLGVNRATRLLGPPDAHREVVRRDHPARRLHDAPTTRRARPPRPPRRPALTARGGARGAGRRSSATSSRCRPASPRSRSTASGPTSGCATVSRSS